MAIKHISSKLMISDSLTKELPPKAHKEHRPGPGAGQEGQLPRAPTCPGPNYNNIILKSSMKDHPSTSEESIVSETLHFQRGSVDEFTFEGPKLGKVVAIWVSLESG